MMVLREIQRRPLRTLFSAAGMAGAVALLILGRFGWDSIVTYFESTFRREQRQDVTVTFSRPMRRAARRADSDSARASLARRGRDGNRGDLDAPPSRGARWR
jgi:hypothetical protein